MHKNSRVKSDNDLIGVSLEEKIAKMLNGLIRANEERIKNGNMGRMGEDACEYGARDILIPNP